MTETGLRSLRPKPFVYAAACFVAIQMDKVIMSKRLWKNVFQLIKIFSNWSH